MTTPYLPLPSDSDGENDNAPNPVPMSDDEESDHISSPEGYPYVPIVPDSDAEEDPDEDPEENPEETSWESNDTNVLPLSSVPMISFEITAPTRQTARRRVATPQRVTLSPEHTVPTTDPYQGPTDNSQSWEQTLDTLHKWRNAGRNRSTFEQGESSTARGPLFDTTPIIVDRMMKHENRMDLLEDALMQMPESEAYAMLEDHVISTEEDISGVREAVQCLTAKLESTNLTIKGMESTIEKLQHQSHRCQLMEVIYYEAEAHAMKGKHKKDEN